MIRRLFTIAIAILLLCGMSINANADGYNGMGTNPLAFSYGTPFAYTSGNLRGTGSFYTYASSSSPFGTSTSTSGAAGYSPLSYGTAYNMTGGGGMLFPFSSGSGVSATISTPYSKSSGMMSGPGVVKSGGGSTSVFGKSTSSGSGDGTSADDYTDYDTGTGGGSISAPFMGSSMPGLGSFLYPSFANSSSFSFGGPAYGSSYAGSPACGSSYTSSPAYSSSYTSAPWYSTMVY